MDFIHARKALLHKGWADDVRFGIDGGRITGIFPAATPERGDLPAGIVIPGLCNAHSHAFQRALSGHTEQRSPAGHDNFWTWRERMYALAGTMNAERLRAIAAQAYSEMLVSGFTSVAEFHYLHREPGGDADDDAMFGALCRAASDTGIRLTYVPVLYERAGFDRPQPEQHQQLFALDVEKFLAHHARASEQSSARISVGMGAHSLRAVCAESLQAVAAVAADARAPMHLHIAEQQREIDQCLAAYGRRPVRWLLENCAVDTNWCLVHATHMDADEIDALAQSGAVVCLCPSTEANLGDGLFPLADFLRADGRIAIGSDSHVSINPFEELRWLEYGQRLAAQSRNIAAFGDSHVGRELFERVLAGGSRASGQATAGIAVGAPADLVVLDDDDPMLVGHDDTSLLDALVFSGYRLPIERVLVDGQWRVIDGDHVEAGEIGRRFADVLGSMRGER